MTAREALFPGHGDFLQHTLANATKAVQPRQVTLADGAQVRLKGLGVLQLQPVDPRPERLILSAGIHGNETAPLELCNELVGTLLAGAWRVRTPTLIIFGNPPAIAAGQRSMGLNLNRLFAGAHLEPGNAGHQEAERARALEAHVAAFAKADEALYHYDLHTAIRASHRERFGLCPYVPGREVPPAQLAVLRACDLSALVLQRKTGTTFAAWTAAYLGAESFTWELGRVRPLGQNDPSRLAATAGTLEDLMQGRWPAPQAADREALAFFHVSHEIINTGPGFRLEIGADTPNFTECAPGTLIWQDARESYRVGDEPQFILFPNPEVAVGQRAGLMVK